MARLLLILALVAIAFWVYTIVDCAVQPAARHRGVSKPAWMVIVILVPVLGGILWFLIGRGRAGRPVVRRAPDDDPEFPGGLSPRARADQDERIRQLEEELAKLDEELGAGGPAPAPDDGTTPDGPDGSEGDERPDGGRGTRG